MQKKDNVIRRRLRASYITSVISISLVLYMLGLIGLLLLNTKKLSDYVKENIGFSIFLNDDIKEVEIFGLQKILDAKHFVKETRYITKEKAIRDFQEEWGEDFEDFLGFNPLPASIDVKLYAPFANTDSIEVIEKDILNYNGVRDVVYQKDLIYKVNNNIRRISITILAFSLLLFLIALTLINNTIRLSVYAKRFIIRTMQLVGAQSTVIRRPFLYNSLYQGILSAFIAIGLLIGTMIVAERQLEGLFSLKDYRISGILFSLVIVIGVMLALISARLAVNRYLTMTTDELYS
ncbi:MAG: cell division protein FtsX [Bacteroidales bacterium]|nr:cell division protein FtsX [Bacteroidales bacterium]MBN2764043.1 cell division protein FtsX [Bacteroidales bacterium]